MSRNVTGRDNYTIAKALCYAIVLIDSLPKRKQEASDREDMEKLLRAMKPNADERNHCLKSARDHMMWRPAS
jgi:hypothetical protein